MKLCLVRPCFSEKQKTIYPPMGLVTLASHFDNKHSLAWADCQIGQDGFLGNSFDATIFSCFTSQLGSVEKSIRFAKSEGIKSKFVVGGPAVTSNPEYAKQLVPSADLLIAGDGEYFAESAEDILSSKTGLVDFRQIPYPLERKKTPSWNLIDYQRYTASTGLAVETSRGCPYSCVMCTAHMIHGRKWRGRKPADIVNELRLLKQRYNCSKFYFPDDNATADPKRWFELMQQINFSGMKLDLSAPEGIQAHHLDNETLLEMSLAGMKRFTIGAESGCQRVLDKVINKGGLTVEKIEWVVRHSVASKMYPSCFFVIGFPGETLEEARQTVMFAEKLRRLGAESCTVRNVIPMPGTKLFELSKREGYLTVDEDRLFDFRFVHGAKHLLRTRDWEPENIDRLVRLAQGQERAHIVRSNIFKHPRATVRYVLSNH